MQGTPPLQRPLNIKNDPKKGKHGVFLHRELWGGEEGEEVSGEKIRVIGVMLVAVLAVSVGEAMLAKGMKLTNSLEGGAGAQLRAALNPLVIGGTLLMALYFGCYMLALKWADLSFVLPLTALSYLLGAILAKYYLGETVTPTRWMGAIVITLGVIIVGFGESGQVHSP